MRNYSDVEPTTDGGTGLETADQTYTAVETEVAEDTEFETVEETYTPVETEVVEDTEFETVEETYTPVETEVVEDTEFETVEETYTPVETEVIEEAIPETSFEQEETESFEYPESDLDQTEETVTTAELDETPQAESSEFESTQFDAGKSVDTDSFQDVAEMPVTSFDSKEDESSEVAEPQVEETVAPPPARSRFGDRNVDLPIEVAEDERRHHNDARRFARLLVSEIKLYNEQKVKEGRESSDLYERLREAIDRSREMYDKRVQPPVASKFDYFNYELVNTLAEGDEARLGGGYPGASI